MIGEIMKTKLSLAALLAGGMMVATAGSASAADLGGDCCADLEERVATLEATTARKGNRKVSLKISGWVNEAIAYWDNGVNSDAYQGTNTNATSRIRFSGGAKINHDWSAGYLIELDFLSAATHAFTETADDATSRIALRKSEWWLKNAQLGKISVGQGSSATDDIGFYNQVGISALAFQPDMYQGHSIGLRNLDGTSAGTNLMQLAQAGNLSVFDGPRINRIRYDSPTIGGFVLSASWGEDDFTDVALRYAGAFGDIKVKAAVGYSDNSEPTADIEQIFANAGAMHTPTGLFVHFTWTSLEYDSTRADSDHWQVQAGIQQRWGSLGKTTLFGAYGEVDDAESTLVSGVAGDSSNVERISLGAIQDIDAAAMKLYVTWDHYETELRGVEFQDLDVITFGGVILF